MDDETIDETLDRMGYRGERKEAVKVYVKELGRRKLMAEAGGVTGTDIVMATILFDSLNRTRKGK